MTTQGHPSPLAPLRLPLPALLISAPSDHPPLLSPLRPAPGLPDYPRQPSSGPRRSCPVPTNQTDPVLPSPDRQGSPSHAESVPSVPSRLPMPGPLSSPPPIPTTRRHPCRVRPHRLPPPTLLTPRRPCPTFHAASPHHRSHRPEPTTRSGSSRVLANRTDSPTQVLPSTHRPATYRLTRRKNSDD
jgi:hypothetical protein